MSPSSSPPPSPLVPTSRPPPPAALNWAPALFPIDMDHLPPLPAIRSPALAMQARSSKDYIGSQAGRLSNYNYDDEVGSYRRLEWLGDSKLHDLYAKRLFRKLPSVGSGVLSTLRENLSANDTHSYISWAYQLDRTLLEPQPPKKPSKNWRPLSQVQSVVADMFEAHIGALVEEDREEEVEVWATAFLASVSKEVEEQAQRLAQDARARDSIKRGETKKRMREENTFEGGAEVDPVTKRRRTSYLSDCPSLPTSSPLIRFDDRIDSDASWHTHLILGDATVGCGRGKKQHQAHDASIDNYFSLAAANPDLRLLPSLPPPVPPSCSTELSARVRPLCGGATRRVDRNCSSPQQRR